MASKDHAKHTHKKQQHANILLLCVCVCVRRAWEDHNGTRDYYPRSSDIMQRTIAWTTTWSSTRAVFVLKASTEPTPTKPPNPPNVSKKKIMPLKMCGAQHDKRLYILTTTTIYSLELRTIRNGRKWRVSSTWILLSCVNYYGVGCESDWDLGRICVLGKDIRSTCESSWFSPLMNHT